MEIFFIRHGQTPYNRAHIHQPVDAVLDDLGRQQALYTAKYVRSLKGTHLLSSTFTRAVETATIMNRSLQLPYETWDCLGEIKRPLSILGRPHFGWRSIRYMLSWFYNRTAVFDDEVQGESRLTFLRRIQEARTAFESLPADARLVVVSHSVFINFFVEHICNDNPVPIWKAVLIILKIKRLDNSSITHITFDPKAPDRTCRWNLVSFDDDSHVVT